MQGHHFVWYRYSNYQGVISALPLSQYLVLKLSGSIVRELIIDECPSPANVMLHIFRDFALHSLIHNSAQCWVVALPPWQASPHSNTKTLGSIVARRGT